MTSVNLAKADSLTLHLTNSNRVALDGAYVSGPMGSLNTDASGDVNPGETIQISRTSAGGSGLSNREIGEKLYLSHRAVASHLYRIFPELGVTSRGELPAALAAGETASATEIS